LKVGTHRIYNMELTLLTSVAKSEDVEAYVKKLEYDVEILEEKLRKRRKQRMFGRLCIIIGALALFFSIVLDSVILALIGLPLIFFGVLPLLLSPIRFEPKNMLYFRALPPLIDLDRLLTDLGYEKNAYYLPPSYCEAGEVRLFIPSKYSTAKLPSKVISDTLFFTKPKGILLVPPGMGLMALCEEEVETDFSGLDLKATEENLRKALTKLEIVKNLKLTENGDYISVTLTGLSIGRLCKEIQGSTQICLRIGCPICGTIACVIAKAVGKPITLYDIKTSPDFKTVMVKCRVCTDTMVDN